MNGTRSPQASAGKWTTAFNRAALSVFEVLCSLKLAVIVLLALASGCALATILESLYDTQTAQYWVYRSWWFHGVLGMLGANIFCVAMSRYPWKPRHTPFLLAHAGILILLFGSWLTDRFGLDGILRVSEGQTNSVVEINTPMLVLTEGEKIRSIPIRWTPPNATFTPVEVDEYQLIVDQFLAHADVQVSFKEAPKDDTGPTYPAVKLRLVAGKDSPPAMKGILLGLNPHFWLWGGDPAWTQVKAGPATLTLNSGNTRHPLSENGPALDIRTLESGKGIEIASSGLQEKQVLRPGKIKGARIRTGWRGGIEAEILDYQPRAISQVDYSPSKMLYGNQAPPSAIHLKARSRENAQLWLGLGDRAVLEFQGRTIAIAYQPKRLMLPFGVHLEHFEVERYQGTQDPAEYSSRVRIDNGKGPSGKEVLISMNEPMAHQGMTFYQSSYEDAQPRPVTSIFSVNQDPGRWFKYIGSLLIVFGSILLFVMKSIKSRQLVRAAAKRSSP